MHLRLLGIFAVALSAAEIGMPASETPAVRAAGNQADDAVCVADVDGMGIPPVHVWNLLSRAGIGASMFGGWTYGIIVQKRDVARSLDALYADAKLRPYEYVSIRGYSGKLGMPDSAKWPLKKIGIDLDQIESSPGLRRNRNLLALAREACRELISGHSVQIRRRPYLREMRLFPMQYLNAQGKFESGYDAEVEVGFRSSPDNYFRIGAYAWDNGGSVVFRWATGPAY